MTRYHQDAASVADAIIAEVGREIVLGLPLGLGKANHIANALYARAAADPSIKLTVFTALTLEKPKASNELERRFMDPVIARLFGDWPELAYARALRSGTMPANIEVNEFFFLAGSWLGVKRAQQSYISANYTHAVRYLVERGVNVVAQLVARRGDRYSLSCNPDTILDLMKTGAKFLLAGEVNAELPFMPGDAEQSEDAFAHVLDSPSTQFSLFGPPREPIDLTEYAIGIHAARLVADGGTLQIGIGEEGDAAVQAMILRHKDNSAFREAVSRLTGGAPPLALEHHEPFAQGLYGVSEMFVDGFLELMDAGILRREVDGALLHAAFFLGPKSFYRRLREMAPERLAKLRMSAVSFTNELYGDQEAKTRARVKGRFINSAMMATLLGALVSDGLEDGRVVSGVGGQHNFVTQAFALPDARSIICVKSTRTARGRTLSNIRYSYGHVTIPRHERDVIVSEYGIADLRGKSDENVIAAMLAIADSRFQPELLRAARDAGKIAKSYEIPAAFRDNTPERIARALKPLDLPPFPFGTDFTPVEQRLLFALEKLKAAQPMALARFALAGLSKSSDADALARMGLDRPRSLSDRFYAALVNGALG
ncbi:MAG TPA: acetyl-CoA hydrolase/transferase C-terminal domain-containing protein [Rhizomicrobium sp.]|nr:acetyl-CoA hydrolase/transferase C-terminal domain-containing protein [Rhizomicrobium sp.]